MKLRVMIMSEYDNLLHCGRIDIGWSEIQFYVSLDIVNLESLLA